MCRLLLVDDEPWVRRLIQERIPWGALKIEEVRAAEDGLEALATALAWAPDILLTDIVMPGLSGIDLVRRLHEAGQSPHVLLLSGFSEFEYARTAVRLGCDDYLLKPVNLEELKESLRKAVAAVGERGAEPPGGLAAEIAQFVEENFARPLTLEEVARRFFLHPNSLSRLFPRELGKTFHEYLRDVRLKHAKSLLAAGRSPAEVGALVGYPDPSHFSRVFKRATGVSPGAYRRSRLP